MYKAKIYKLVNNFDNALYIGSTTQPLCNRFRDHKITSNKKQNIRLYSYVNESGRWNNWKIVLIEFFECNNREEKLNENNIGLIYIKTM